MSSLSQVLVEKVESISPHFNADSLELLNLSNGFTVVDKIGKFKVGELIGYSPVDMVAPEKEEFEFLRKEKFRIKGKKIRGIISCGLAMKLDHQDYELNTDLTERLEFKPYESPEPSRPGASLGKTGNELKPPVQMSKYDIESIRKYHRIFDPEIVVLEKIHGCVHQFTSVRTINGEEIYIKDLKVGDRILSYNEELQAFENDEIIDVLCKKSSKEWMQLHFDNGRVLTCTVDHKILTKRGWIEAQFLTEDDEFIEN